MTHKSNSSGRRPPRHSSRDVTKLNRKYRYEYIASCIQDGMDIKSAVRSAQEVWDPQQISRLDVNQFGCHGKLLAMYNASVQNSIRRLGCNLDDSVAIHECENGMFNASIQRTRKRVRIVVNSGMLQLIYQANKVMSFAWQFYDENEIGDRIPKGQLSWSKNRIVKALSEILRHYFTSGDVTQSPRYPIPGGVRYRIMEGFLIPAEEFVLAHEYGHLLAGHTEQIIQSEMNQGVVQDLAESHCREFQADLYALRILLAPCDFSESGNRMTNRFRIGGVGLFFNIASLVEQVGEEVYEYIDPSISCHPPATERLKRLKTYLAQKYNDPRVMDLLEFCDDWFRNYTGDVIDALKMVHPNATSN